MVLQFVHKLKHCLSSFIFEQIKINIILEKVHEYKELLTVNKPALRKNMNILHAADRWVDGNIHILSQHWNLNSKPTYYNTAWISVNGNDQLYF